MGRWKGWRNRGFRGPAIPLLVVIMTVLLIYRLSLSISGEMGQAGDGLGSFLMPKLCVRVMESSSLLRYQSEEKGSEDLLMTMLTREFPAYAFAEERLSSDGLLHSLLPGQRGDDYLPMREDDRTEEASEQGIVKEHAAGKDETEEQKYAGEIGFHDITQGILPKEYILTNGAAFDQSSFLALQEGENRGSGPVAGQLAVGIIEGEVYVEEGPELTHHGQGSEMEVMKSNIGNAFTLEDLKDINFLLRNFYIIDPDTSIVDELFVSEKLLAKDMTMKQSNDQPQILIYHTHSREAYADSREGVISDTVVGMGNYLTRILEERYGYRVIHDTTAYDTMSQGDANLAYKYAYNGISKILKENPTIEVVIDLHRDGVEKRSTILEGRETAQVMLFNGLSRNKQGPRTDLDNPYLQDNLAFSLQLQLKALEKYPGLFYRNYLKGYRYNLHLRPKSILIELGTYKNTVASAKNALEPFAEVLDEVLQGP